MPNATFNREDIGRIGNEVYPRDIRNKVMPQHKVEFLILDIGTGDCMIDKDDLSAEEILKARRPHGVLFGLRIGYTSAYTLAGRMIEDAS